MLEICSIGGFSKTEGNSIAVNINGKVIILDMGLSMENYILYTEDREDISAKTYKELLKAGAVPDYNHINDWKEKVIAIVPSHAHLDHIGAIPFSSSLFPPVPIISTPYTIEVIKSILADEKLKLDNKLVPVPSNSSYKLTDEITLEFIHTTHSIPHTAMVAIHTKEGTILYANDYKLDPHPVIGRKPNTERLQELGKEKVKLLIINCLYAHEHTKCPSESVAREMLRDVLLGIHSEKKAIIVTTFSSHLARLKSTIELGKKLGRKVILLGRSLSKYVEAAERIDLVQFSKDATFIKYREKVDQALRRIQKEGKEKYLIVCTGHQGEPRAVLSRMARGELDFKFESGDMVIFSCAVIPVEINQQNREKLEKNLEVQGVRLFRNVHVSGHGAREDHRDLIEMVKPQNIIPIHAEPAKGKMMAELALQLGYKNTFVLEDGKRATF